MDHDSDQERKPESTAHDGGGATQVTDLPKELLADVVKHLTTDNPFETAKNLTNFKLVSRSAREAVETAPVKTFHGRLKRLVESAGVLLDIAVRGFWDQEEIYIPASAPASAVAPTLKFLPVRAKSNFVLHILNLPHASEQALAIASIARRLGDLDHANKDRLVNRAIELFGQDGQEWVDRAGSANSDSSLSGFSA
ncbi:hypothetical protein NLM33_47805 (plasmid) [Bradyrhizobium sp. CCGUVB1N3]|uniref:hypothetical protein n=1 Tax=Bradyrhizobium sp. CCGUVB1N3 TaxID=2949629 RepID=UPI0020B37759|nr:hypothetical protein [Bradyrhizobium sp. CCGUVB1N3]MCP3477808.1 hypothetical protein [Bradyrhizobium sp. CCGUVB1N3]